MGLLLLSPHHNYSLGIIYSVDYGGIMMTLAEGAGKMLMSNIAVKLVGTGVI